MSAGEAGRAVGHDHDADGRHAAPPGSVRSGCATVWRAPARRARSSTSGSVSGSTPWPRLNTWPPGGRRSRARAQHVALRPRWAPSRRRHDGGVEVALQRRRRPAPAGGRRRGASASRPPRPRRPAPAIRPSSSPVSTPKWMRGTPRSASAASTLVLRRQHEALVVLGDSAPAHESNSCSGRGARRRPGTAARRSPGRPGGRSGRARAPRRCASGPWCARRCGDGRPSNR